MTKTNYMPTFAEVRAQIEANYNKINEIAAKIKESRAAWENLSPVARMQSIKETPKSERIMREWESLERQKEYFADFAKILSNNLKVAFIYSVLPCLCEILKKYNGKKAGEKTCQKIAEELQAACGASFYFIRSSLSHASEQIKIYELKNGYRDGSCVDVEVCTKGREKIITDENIINALSLDAFALNSFLIIENPAERLEEIAKAREAVNKARDDYNAAAAAYNALTVDGFDRAERIYKTI